MYVARTTMIGISKDLMEKIVTRIKEIMFSVDTLDGLFWRCFSLMAGTEDVLEREFVARLRHPGEISPVSQCHSAAHS
jgi:hypothetical protein